MSGFEKYKSLGDGYHWDWLEKAKPYLARIVTWLSYLPYDGRGFSVLDFGCGDGVPAWFLSNRGYAVFGYDCLVEPLTIARTRVPGAIFSTTFPLHIIFDYAIAFGVLEHMDNLGFLVEAITHTTKFSLVSSLNPGIRDPWTSETRPDIDWLTKAAGNLMVNLVHRGEKESLYKILPNSQEAGRQWQK